MSFPQGYDTSEASDFAFACDTEHGLAWRILAEKVGIDIARSAYKVAFMSASIWHSEMADRLRHESNSIDHFLSLMSDEKLGLHKETL